MSNELKIFDDTFKTNLITRVRERLVTRFSPEALAQIDANVRFDLISSQVVVMFERSAIKSEVGKTVRQETIEIPVSWLDHLLLSVKDKLPAKMGKRLKPKLKSIVTAHTEIYEKVCPHAAIPNNRQEHLSWLATLVPEQVFKNTDGLVFPDLIYHLRKLGSLCGKDSRFDAAEHEKILTKLRNYIA